MIVTLLQTSLFWQNPEANRDSIAYQLRELPQTDLVILPEMFTTGFTMSPKPFAEKMNGVTISWLRKISAEKNCAIAGSIIIEESRLFYNRMLFVTPNGELTFYDKRHLFTLAGEQKTYTKGNEKITVDYKGWKILLQICYDLRFPVFSRNVENYDIAIYVANWPEPRIHAWNTLLMSRAIENMSYVIGVNRIGNDDNNHHYTGSSQVIDPLGIIKVNGHNVGGLYSTVLDKKLIEESRVKLNFLNDKDDFTVS